MSLASLARHVVRHPLNRQQRTRALIRLLRWQLGSRILKGEVIVPFVDDVSFICATGRAGLTQNIYCGLADPQEMGLLLHFLRHGDLFVDVGANVGSYTLLASGCCGANSVSIEPGPLMYRNLTRNLRINDLENVQVVNLAVGSVKGEIHFNASQDSQSHVLSPGEDATEVLIVGVDTLDHLVTADAPTAIKIDVEGFESDVVMGAELTLQNPKVKVVLIELIGHGSKYGKDERAVESTLLRYGYREFTYDPIARQLTENNTFGQKANKVFIRDRDFVQSRCCQSRQYLIRSNNMVL